MEVKGSKCHSQRVHVNEHKSKSHFKSSIRSMVIVRVDVVLIVVDLH